MYLISKKMGILSIKKNPARKIAFIYLVIGIIWILFSDNLLHFFIHNTNNELLIQTTKGTIFVITTALIIYYFVKIEIKKKDQINSALKQTKQRLDEAQQLGKIGSWEYNLSDKKVHGSKEAYRIFGFASNVIISQVEIAKHIHSSDRKRYLKHTKQWITGVNIKPISYKIVVNNEIKHISENATIIRNGANEIIRLYGTIQDVSSNYKYQYELKEAHDRYKFIFNAANVGMSVTNFEGKIIDYNTTWIKIMGYNKNDVKKLKVSELYYDIDERDVLVETLEKEGKLESYEIKFRHKSGAPVWLNFYAKIVTLKNEKVILSIANDITKRKSVEEELRKSEIRYKQLFINSQTAYAYHQIITNNNNEPIDYIFLEVNPQFEELTGLKRDYIIGKRVLEVLPNTEKYWIEKYGKVALSGEPIKFQTYSSDFNKHFDISAYSPIKGKFVVSFSDITTRRQSDKKIELYQENLKNLIYELFATEEKEKREIAINLHDHFSQLLALSKMKIAEFKRNKPELKTNTKLIEATNYIEQALEQARSITYELSPPILYELGLIEAMEWYIGKTKSENNFEIKFFKNTDEIIFSQQTQIIIYRIFTELMINIIKHARAKTIMIIIEQVNEMFYLRVVDDGIGFNPEESKKKDSFGLFSIKERVEHLNGIAHIISSENVGRGTVIDISIPNK